MMIIPAPTDVALYILSFPIYWYGIIMALAILIGILTANKLCQILFGKKDLAIEYAPLIIIVGILGARLYFCMLNPIHYLSNPIEILDIREGGLSIHGALIGGIGALFYIAKKNNLSFLGIMDAFGCGTILGQAIGRWGNYFNSEAYGLPTSGQNWGLFIPQERRIAQYADFSLFHPTFLYESILDVAAFLILLFIFKKFSHKYKGITFFSYLTIYALIRFFIERIRVDSALNFGNMPIAELVSVFLFTIGIIGLIYLAKKYFHNKNGRL